MALVDIGTAAYRLGLSYNQVLRLVLVHQLEAVKVAGRWRIEQESLERFAREREQAGQPAKATP